VPARWPGSRREGSRTRDPTRKTKAWPKARCDLTETFQLCAHLWLRVILVKFHHFTRCGGVQDYFIPRGTVFPYIDLWIRTGIYLLRFLVPQCPHCWR